jgi:5-methylcytosine-specific restriction endonuclease McrA
MDSVSQNGRRKARPWTAQEQITAEVAAACGVAVKDIADLLNRHVSVVTYKLKPASMNAALTRHRRYHQENKDQRNAQKREYYAANREKSSRRSKIYYQANRSKAIQQQRAWCLANKEWVAERQRSYRASRRVEILEAKRKWAASNPQMVRDQSRRRKSIVRAGRRKAIEPLSIQLRNNRFKLWDNSCAYCGNSGAQEVDHVLALTQGGLDEANNVAPACRRCNASKNDRPVETWYRRQPFFTEARWRKIQRHCPAAVAGQLPLALPV